MNESDSSEFVLCLTKANGVDFVRPKYWTGRMLERWPELSSNPENAFRFTTKQAANEVRSGLANRGFFGAVRPV
jgi:hypothetical protein